MKDATACLPGMIDLLLVYGLLLEEALTGLRELFEQRIRYDEAKERAFDILHQKMRQSETDHESSLKMGLILSLLLLHDRMRKAESELIETATARRIYDLRTQLLDILYAEGVEPIETTTEVFDRSRTIPSTA